MTPTLEQIFQAMQEIKQDLAYLKRQEADRKLTTKEVADMLNKTERTVRNWIKTRNLPVIKPDGDKSNLIFIKRDIENWLTQNSL